MWDVGCGVWDVGCGVWDVGLGDGEQEIEPMAWEAMGFGSDQLCDGGLIALRICCSRDAAL